MVEQRFSVSRTRLVLCGLMLLGTAGPCAAVEPTPAATAAFNSYIEKVEARLAQRHGSANGFLALEPQNAARLRQGETIVEKLTPATGAEFSGAMLHDWRGSAFAPGATAADFERLMRDFNAYPQRFAPEVTQATIQLQQGDYYQATMRVKQKHVITVVMDTSYDIVFGKLDDRRGYSRSRSTRIVEIDAPGTSKERTLSGSEEHGFLWRLNTYWSYEERDGGLYMQIESVSLTRSIPTGLGWAIGPFVESIPLESLEFTLRATRDALRK